MWKVKLDPAKAWESIQEEVRRKEEEAQRLAEQAERKLMEAKREIDKKIQEEKEQAAKEAKRLEDEARQKAKKLEDEARQKAEELKKIAKSNLVSRVNDSIDKLKEELIADATEPARQMIEEIESYKNNLEQLLDDLKPENIIKKALDKAEHISEEYIDSKMVQVFEPLHLKGKSDVECSLDGNKISGSVSLYLVLEDFNGDFTQKFLKSLSITGEVDLSNLSDIDISDPVLHDGNIDIQEEIKSRIEEQQEEIISGLTEAVIDSYLPIFTVINKFKEIMKI
ncbi:ATP synthase F0 subunit B [Bacillus sp. SG20001]|uniref:ATP synthase F0 subunit B n=1 Tax=Bacillus sp. SG20001 TaxID=3074204 RepID=UPI002880B805|nr:ATP synthase F0 subunit B [Bacillus sp. SG20001]WNF51980.1 ATP synthase F0 subunit B [Bacillus sp. SG20001]